MIKLKTIGNPRAYAMIATLSVQDGEIPTAESVLDQVIQLMFAEDADRFFDGCADKLMGFYSNLADLEAEENDTDGVEYLSGRDAERLMMDAYVVGQVLAYGKDVQADVQDAMDNGNTGWWWPAALTYRKEGEVYPREVCERFGLLAGYIHARQDMAFAEWAQSDEGRREIEARLSRP